MSELNFERSCDWDLQAIVKWHVKKVTNIMEMSPNYAWLEDYYQNQENPTLLVDELPQICTPNYINGSSIISSSQNLESTMSIVVNDDNVAKCPIDGPKEKVRDVSYARNSTIASKRRKNKNKRTWVHQATAHRITSDEWNWRKYGEKVIKGSPYPRNYYRCSNSGGCSARKQVKLSCTDPGKYLITYIEEHNHPYSSRRPSQAGPTSRRFHTFPNVILNKTELVDNESSAMTSSVTSQTIIPKDKNMVERGKDDHQTIVECGKGDELFEGFEMDMMCDISPYCDQFSYQ